MLNSPSHVVVYTHNCWMCLKKAMQRYNIIFILQNFIVTLHFKLEELCNKHKKYKRHYHL